MRAEVAGHVVTLFSEKGMLVDEFGTLLIADLHFGKINHFPRAGIPVPPKANDRNTESLIDLLNKVRPARTIFLGDLFHSHFNEEWNVVGQVLRHFPGSTFELVRGNHDIMSKVQYERHGIHVHEAGLRLGNFWLTHEPVEEAVPGLYNLAGHIHPGVRLRGNGRQAMTLPCFYFGSNGGLLPAFGSFTGFVKIPVKQKDQVFIITENAIIRVDEESGRVV